MSNQLSDEDIEAILELKSRRAALIAEANKLTDAKIAEAAGVPRSAIGKLSFRVLQERMAEQERAKMQSAVGMTIPGERLREYSVELMGDLTGIEL